MAHEQKNGSVTRVFLVRHAQSHASVRKVIAGSRTCAGITDLGHTQATLLTARLADERTAFHTLLTSPVHRARQTAEVLADGLRLGTPVIETEVRELDFGAADGLAVDAYERVHGAFDLTAHPERLFAPEGESWNQFRTRAGRVMDDLRLRHPGENVLVVCHAGFIVAAMSALVDTVPPVLFTDSTPAVTSMSEFVHDGSGWTMLRFNDAEHIDQSEHRAVANSESV